MESHYRLKTKEMIVDDLTYILKQNQMIPLSQNQLGMADEMVALSDSVFILYSKREDNSAYIPTKITETKAMSLLSGLFADLNDDQLVEEAKYWKELALFLKEEEQKDDLKNIKTLIQ